MQLYHKTKSANQNYYKMHEASNKISVVIQICKHSVMNVLHTEYGSVVKGHSVLFYRVQSKKTNF